MKIRAQLVTTTGALLNVEPEGDVFTLKELQSYVGGYIQKLKLPNGDTLVCNEDGFNLKLPINELATFLVERSYNGKRTQEFVGDVLFIQNHEIK
jgi:hypothetical protein